MSRKNTVTPNQLMDAIGQVDDALLLEVEELRTGKHSRKKVHRNIGYVSGIVAAACLVIVIGISLKNTVSMQRDTEVSEMAMAPAATGTEEGYSFEESAVESAAPDLEGAPNLAMSDSDSWYSPTKILDYSVTVSFSEDVSGEVATSITLDELVEFLSIHESIVWTVNAESENTDGPKEQNESAELTAFMDDMEVSCKEKNCSELMERLVLLP